MAVTHVMPGSLAGVGTHSGNRRRMWSLGLRLDAQGGGRGGGGGGGGDRSYLCSTPSSCDACRVRLCVPRGGGAPSGASMLSLNDAGVSNAAPTGTAWGTVARPSKKTARNSPQVYSRT